MEELERSLADRVLLRPLRDNFAKNKSKFPAMRTWSVIAPKPGNNQSPGWRSDRDGKTTGSSLVGMVLARRYKILEAVEADSFKAHDLALDQTVTIRQACVKSPGGGDAWRQKVQQFAKVKDPNFLNVIDVIFDKSNVLIVTERPRGRSIADLLRERSRLDVEDVLRLVTPLAGAIDLAAAFSCRPNPISACWLFIETSSYAADLKWRPLSDWPPFLVKLDVWELVRPGKSDMRPFVTAKAQSGGSRALAVRRAALLAYELLGGGKRKDGQAERRFQPVSELSDAANGILCLGLQGSPRFATSESFFHEFGASIQSGERRSRGLPEPTSRTLAHSAALPVVNDIIRRFNRDTVWLVTLVAGALISATLILAVMVQNSHPKAIDFPEKAVQAGNGQITPGMASGADPASNEVSPKEKASSQPEAAVPTPTPVLALTPEKAPSPTVTAASIPTPVFVFTPERNQVNEPTNASLWSPAHRQDTAREIRPKVRNVKYTSSAPHRSGDVKKRLIALWHQSLAHGRNSRGSKAPKNVKGGPGKKGIHTTATSH